MYIYDIDYENNTIIGSNTYPKISYLTKRNEETGVLEPDKVKITKLEPCPGIGLGIIVAENGYVLTLGNKIHVIEHGAFGKSLYETIDKLLMEEIVEYKEYEKDELNDPIFIEAMAKLNSQ